MKSMAMRGLENGVGRSDEGEGMKGQMGMGWMGCWLGRVGRGKWEEGSWEMLV